MPPHAVLACHARRVALANWLRTFFIHQCSIYSCHGAVFVSYMSCWFLFGQYHGWHWNGSVMTVVFLKLPSGQHDTAVTGLEMHTQMLRTFCQLWSALTVMWAALDLDGIGSPGRFMLQDTWPSLGHNTLRSNQKPDAIMCRKALACLYVPVHHLPACQPRIDQL